MSLLGISMLPHWCILTPKVLWVFWWKWPQISPFWKDGELCKVGGFYSTSNCKILYLTWKCACPPNLRHSFLTVCKIITLKKLRNLFFLPMPEGYSRHSEAWKPTFWRGYGMLLSILLFLSELGTCPQNLIPRICVEHVEKIHFPHGGMLKFTYKGRFLTNKKAYEKSLNWKSIRWAHAYLPHEGRGIFFVNKY
jgi:hypothetical protein